MIGRNGRDPGSSRCGEPAAPGQRRASRAAVTDQVLFIQAGGEGVHDELEYLLVESLARQSGVAP